MPNKIALFKQFIDQGEQFFETDRPPSFRALLYSYARRHKLYAKSYETANGIYFAISTAPVKSLSGQPKRGRPDA